MSKFLATETLTLVVCFSSFATKAATLGSTEVLDFLENPTMLETSNAIPYEEVLEGIYTVMVVGSDFTNLHG